MTRTKPGIWTVWQHAKGGIYTVLDNCIIEATDAPAVMYSSLDRRDREDKWVRPLEEFLDKFTPCHMTLRTIMAFENDVAYDLPDLALREWEVIIGNEKADQKHYKRQKHRLERQQAARS